MALESHSNDIAPTLRTLTNWILICESYEQQETEQTVQKALKHNVMFDSNGGGCLWLDAYSNAVFDEFAPTIRTTIQKSCMNFIMEFKQTNKEPKICAMRGRSDGEWHESEHEQRIEMREDDVTNTITGVSKDNMVAEPTKQEVLGWVRDKEGNVIKRPSVDVANTVTSGKRDNTQNYVKEQITLNTDQEGLATTVTTAHHYSGNIVDPKRGQKEIGALETQHNLPFRVRRLTERELFRLMDVSEEDIDKIQAAGISKTQQAKMAGNSIVVSCLYHIFRKMFIDTEQEERQMTLF